MSARLAEVYQNLIAFGVPKAEAATFVEDLVLNTWFARHRRKKFLSKYGEIIQAGASTFAANAGTEL